MCSPMIAMLDLDGFVEKHGVVSSSSGLGSKKWQHAVELLLKERLDPPV